MFDYVQVHVTGVVNGQELDTTVAGDVLPGDFIAVTIAKAAAEAAALAALHHQHDISGPIKIDRRRRV